jgi:hypothetical protein
MDVLIIQLQEMLTLYEIWQNLQIFCQECEGINNRCCQGKNNTQLIIFGGKYSQRLIEN